MGRHGGGSRSGGSSRSSSSRSGGGSRSSGSRSGGRSGGGSGIRTSSTPFGGCYNRSYYDRRGRLHSYYTSDGSYGTKSGWNGVIIFALIFITLHMVIMVGSFALPMIRFGGKVSGDTGRIFVEDKADILTEREEKEVLEIFSEVYEESGMPVTLYTDDFSWKNHYDNLFVYSEELYYSISYDEDAMLILFTTEDEGDFYDWEYDMYCGDDTEKCFSDAAFDELLENFHKGMAGQDLVEALDYSWGTVIDDLAKTTVDAAGMPILLFIFAFYGIFYVAILGGVRKKNAVYRYYKENPDKLSNTPMTLYGTCPNCGASNTSENEVCPYCGSLLKIRDGNVVYINH